MDVYHDKRFELQPSGFHPYDGSTYSSEVRYHDFKENLDLIPEVLEDFLPWREQPSVQQFFSMLRWLNGPESVIESSDCAFKGPYEETDPKRPKRVVVSGRLMILYRDLGLNLRRDNMEMMSNAVQHFLAQADPDLRWEYASVGVSVCTTVFPAFNRGGYRLMLSFWAWGDTDDEAFAALDRLFKALNESLMIVSDEIKKVQQT